MSSTLPSSALTLPNIAIVIPPPGNDSKRLRGIGLGRRVVHGGLSTHRMAHQLYPIEAVIIDEFGQISGHQFVTEIVAVRRAAVVALIDQPYLVIFSKATAQGLPIV